MINFKTENKTLKKYLELLIGSNKKFISEHQFLNASILIVGLMYFINVIINPIMNIEFRVTLIAIIVTIFSSLLYYYSRFRFYFIFPCLSIFIIILFGLSIDWFYNGGIDGCTPFFYLVCIAYILYLTKKKLKIILSSIWFLNISALFLIEYKYPSLLVNYISRKQKYSDLYFSYCEAAILIMFLIYIAKKLYLQEKQNTIEIIEQYRQNGEVLKKEYNNKFEQLSLREREVFQLILESNTNQEIADKLFIEVGTVKIHINKIYKKLGMKSRKDAVNFAEGYQKTDLYHTL